MSKIAMELSRLSWENHLFLWAMASMASSGREAGCIPVVVRSWSQGGDPLVKLQVGLMLD